MGSSVLVSNLATSTTNMNFKILFVFTICLIGLSLAVPMPWVQGGAVSDAAALETDLENPLTADPSDPHIFYNFRFPMTCGELCFNGSGCGACEEEPAA